MNSRKILLIGAPCSAALFCTLLVVTQPRANGAPEPAVSNTAFPNPVPVNIVGYTGSAEVPYLTPDGNYLVFDSRTDAGNGPINVYYAKKINATNFLFMGEVGNVNVPGTINLEVTIDDNNNFYFTRIPINGVPPQPTGQPSIYRGVWNNGTLVGVAPVPGIGQNSGTINQDPSISHDGQTLIFDTWNFVNQCLTYEIALENTDTSFTVLSSGDPRLTAYLATVNNTAVANYLYRCTSFPSVNMTYSMLMGPVLYSHSGLMVVYTMIQPGPGGMPVEKYYIATRSSLSQPFGSPQLMINNGRVVEGGSFSPDDQLLYFHLSQGDGTFWPYVIAVGSNASS
jgi:hypothetical protein